jgi:small subunit ribosomal protein S16
VKFLAVSIRLKRMGRKKKPFYRIVVADERNPRQGRSADDLGYYDPIPDQIQIDEEKAMKWLNDGAKPTETVKSILSKTGVLSKFHAQRQSIPLDESNLEEEKQKAEQSAEEEKEAEDNKEDTKTEETQEEEEA